MLMESTLAGVLLGALSGCVLPILPFATVVVASLVVLVGVLWTGGAPAGTILIATATLLCSFQFGYVAGLAGRAAFTRPRRRALGGEPAAGRTREISRGDISHG